MHKTPDFKPPVFHRDAAAALAQVQAIYQASVAHLRAAMREFVAGHDFAQTRVRACYPFVRLHTHSVTHKGSSRLSYGFVAGPGRFETTITRPDLYADYLLNQFELLLTNHGGELEVGTSTQPIPIHFSFAEHDHVEGQLSAERRALLRHASRTLVKDGHAGMLAAWGLGQPFAGEVTLEAAVTRVALGGELPFALTLRSTGGAPQPASAMASSDGGSSPSGDRPNPRRSGVMTR